MVSTCIACSAAPFGFSENSVTCPSPLIFISPNAPARSSSQGRQAMVMSASDCRCFATNSR